MNGGLMSGGELTDGGKLQLLSFLKYFKAFYWWLHTLICYKVSGSKPVVFLRCLHKHTSIPPMVRFAKINKTISQTAGAFQSANVE